jgi:hypothetical protein
VGEKEKRIVHSLGTRDRSSAQGSQTFALVFRAANAPEESAYAAVSVELGLWPWCRQFAKRTPSRVENEFSRPSAGLPLRSLRFFSCAIE